MKQQRFEAFWSSSATMPATVKFAVGAVLWSLAALYFTFAGRLHGSESHQRGGPAA